MRFNSFEQDHPFPIAEIEPLDSVPAKRAETEALSMKLLELYNMFKRKGRKFPDQVDEYLSQLGDPEMLADLMAATFVSDARRRQELLEELSVTRRLRLVIKYLREESGASAL